MAKIKKPYEPFNIKKQDLILIIVSATVSAYVTSSTINQSLDLSILPQVLVRSFIVTVVSVFSVYFVLVGIRTLLILSSIIFNLIKRLFR